jgi:hypothetical protein
MPIARVSDLELHYERRCEGPTLLLMAGIAERALLEPSLAGSARPASGLQRA